MLNLKKKRMIKVKSKKLQIALNMLLKELFHPLKQKEI